MLSSKFEVDLKSAAPVFLEATILILMVNLFRIESDTGVRWASTCGVLWLLILENSHMIYSSVIQTGSNSRIWFFLGTYGVEVKFCLAGLCLKGCLLWEELIEFQFIISNSTWISSALSFYYLYKVNWFVTITFSCSLKDVFSWLLYKVIGSSNNHFEIISATEPYEL